MQTAVTFLVGALLGVTMTWWLLSTAYQNALRAHHSDGRYIPARQAVARHLRVHGTLNRAQLERMMDIDSTATLAYLDRMVQDGLLARHDHRDGDAFYTLK